MITLTSAVTCGFPDTPGNVVNWFKTCPLSLNSQRENNATRESRKSVKQFSFLWSASPLEGSRVHGPSLSLSYPLHPGAPTRHVPLCPQPIVLLILSGSTDSSGKGLFLISKILQHSISSETYPRYKAE